MTLFSYSPSYGTTNDPQLRIKSSTFGDGYEQRQPDGINPIKEVWSVSFTDRESTEIDQIEAFIKARGGVEYFTWIPPRQTSEKKFICKKWSRSIVKGNIDSFSAIFEQVFES